MTDLYSGVEFVAAKEGGANTGNIDATFENFEKQSHLDTHFITVLSAMREEDTFNTTKNLVEIATLLVAGDELSASTRLTELKEYHIYLLEKNHSDLKDRGEMLAFIEGSFKGLLGKILSRDTSFVPSEENDYCIKIGENKLSLKGFGETFCAEFYKKLCNIRGLDIGLIDVSSQSNKIEPGESKEEIFSHTLDFFKQSIGGKLTSGQNMIVPGYIGGIDGGIEQAIGEGYSDATAALIAVSIKELLGEKNRVLLEILKSVPGIMSADPRLLQGSNQEAQVLREIDFWIAKEIVGVRGAQAKLLNSFAMLPRVIQSGIDIRLRDPSLEGDSGTLISHNTINQEKGVQSVLGRRNVAMISISSFSMGQGFISKITEIVREYASVDIIGTSETEFAFTVDMKSGVSQDKIQEMIKRLENNYLNKFGDSIKTEFHNGLLFCVGHNMKQSGILKKAGNALEKGNISANLVSQGLMQRALIFGIDNEKDIEKGVQLLHGEFQLSK